MINNIPLPLKAPLKDNIFVSFFEHEKTPKDKERRWENSRDISEYFGKIVSRAAVSPGAEPSNLQFGASMGVLSKNPHFASKSLTRMKI